MIVIRDLGVNYGAKGHGRFAVRGVSFSFGTGISFGLSGQSGSGKSTVLHSIAGLIGNWEGTIEIDEQLQFKKRSPAFYRHVQLLFQDSNSALHPRHMVETSLAEPAIIHNLGDVDLRVGAALKDVGLEDNIRYRYPHQLSGGQRQRVALARAIVREPTVFLMDEPLSNLDAKLRVSTRAQIKNLQHNLKVTTIYVTHDQVEAMTLADRVVVMNDGIVQQVGTPQEIYNKPANSFVASFIGSPAMNLLKGSISDGVFTSEGVKIGGLNNKHKGNVTLGFRAEDAVIVKSKGDISAPAFSMELLGDMTMVSVKSGGDLISIKSDKNYHADIGSTVMANISPNLCLLFDSENGQMLENL